MRLRLSRIIDGFCHVATCVAVAWSSLCQAAAPVQQPWAARGDVAFHMAINPSLVVNALAQDRQGFLWLGGQAGLMRWDGYKLKTFLSDVADPGALPDSYILALRTDSRGRLWVGTSAGGIARYDELQERFELPVPAAALSRRSVASIAEDVDGSLLLGTGGGLDRLDPARHTVRRHAEWAAALGLPSTGVNAVLVDRHGAVWAGTDLGVYRRAADGLFVKVPLGRSEAGQGVVSCMLEDGEGRIWVGTRANGVFTVDPGSSRAKALHERVAEPMPGLAMAIVHGLLEARPGEVWVATGGQGIFRVDLGQGQVRRANHIENVPGSLPKNEVMALFRDRQGLVWAATDIGLSFHDAQQTAISTWFGGDHDAAARKGGLITANIPFVLPMADGTVWLSTGEGGIDIVSPTAGRLRSLRPDPSSPSTALPDGRVISMALSPDGRQVYAGTRRGLYRVSIADLRVQRLTVPGRSPTADVWSVAWQGKRLWVGGLDGLWGVQAGQGSTLRVTARQAGDGLEDQRITALLPDADDRLWVGTRSGLAVLDTTTMRVQQLPQDAPGRIGMAGGFIASIVKDTHGRFWVAGYGSGIRVFEPSPQGPVNLRRLSMAEGLPTNAVNALVIDRQGDVWASTDDGIMRIAHDSLETVPIGSAEGVGVLGYWSGSGGVTADGHVLFGGSGGLTIVDPRQGVNTPTAPPPLVVTEVRPGDGPRTMAYQPGRESAPLQLKPGRRSLLVEFAGLHYAAPAAVRYQYRLHGVDARWLDTDANHRFAAYTNLPPGEHVLELRAATAKGAWSDIVSMPLHVQPAWHETAWARATLGLVGASTLLLLMRARTLVLRRRQRMLEALVAERTRQLEDSQRQLEQIAYFDSLSGLANRRMFNDELKRMVAASLRSGHCLALVLIDLDHFKQINDTLGHDAGDAMLVAVAQRLLSAMRETDRVVRLGGDEFAILLPEVDGTAAVERVCERIFAALAPPVMHRGSTMQPRASVGAALCPGAARTPDELYKAADIALYESKRAGRNGWRVWASSDVAALPSASATQDA
jgi:diguanylate cyclase (GGDEF)-like protein